MKFRINPLLAATDAPPIPEVQSWAACDAASCLPLIDLLQAVPGYPPDSGLTDYLAEKVQDPSLSLYTPISGTMELREAFAADVAATYGAEIGPECICITAGCNQAFYAAMIALAKTGDNIVLTVPYYFNHRMTLDMLGLEARLLPAHPRAGFIPDPEEAAELFNERTRALVLVSPNNPTGSVIPPEILDRFYDQTERSGIALILDETYRDFLPPDQVRAHGLFGRPQWQDTLIHLYSFSKAYSLAGYRVGALAASPRLVAEYLKIMDCLVICAPYVSQIAALYGLENLGEWRRQKRFLMAARVDAFRRALEGHAGRWRVGSIGAYFAYLRHPWSGLDSLQAARRLAETQRLLCLPGSAFGPGQDSYLRCAFANVDAAEMPEISRRLP